MIETLMFEIRALNLQMLYKPLKIKSYLALLAKILII